MQIKFLTTSLLIPFLTSFLYRRSIMAENEKIDELITKIKDAIENLITLEIVTAVGNVTVSSEDEKLSVVNIENAPAILTKIDLIQGDIKTIFHEEFVTGNYKDLKDFHAEREGQGHEIIKGNLEALKKLFDLAKNLKNG